MTWVSEWVRKERTWTWGPWRKERQREHGGDDRGREAGRGESGGPGGVDGASAVSPGVRWDYRCTHNVREHRPRAEYECCCFSRAACRSSLCAWCCWMPRAAIQRRFPCNSEHTAQTLTSQTTQGLQHNGSAAGGKRWKNKKTKNKKHCGWRKSRRWLRFSLTATSFVVSSGGALWFVASCLFCCSVFLLLLLLMLKCRPVR